MGVNNVKAFGKVLVDLTGDTVTSETLQEGVTAHNAAGDQITGTMVVQELDILATKEELEANTESGKVVDALVVKDINSSLTANGSQLCMDYHDGKYGVNTDPERGADTFIPFKASTPYAFLSFYDYSSTPNRTKLNVIAYSEFECDSNILTVKEAGTYRILCPVMYFRGLYVWINDKIVFSCGNLGTIDKSVALNDGDKIYISVDDGSVQHTSRSGFIVKIE